MNGFRDHAHDALRKAGAPALQRISEHAQIKGLPAPVRRLLEYLLEHLFDPKLNVRKWREGAGIRNNEVSSRFRSWLGAKMKDYYRGLRVETAARMLATTDLGERRIGRTVGFTSFRNFEKVYKEWTGKTPSEGRDLPAPRIGPVTMQRASCGELTAEELERHVAELYRIHPHARPEAPANAAVEVRREVDGGDYELFRADRLWRRVRSLPFEEQQREVRAYRFHSTVFFDLLRKKSREEGRKDRARGVRLAKLALVSLDGHDEIFGGRIHDLRALGWTAIANARHLMLDFDGAEVDLASADGEWAVPRAMKDLGVSAEIHLIKGALRTCQRRYAEALERVDESIRLSELAGDAVLQAQALTVGASVKGYTERLRESTSDLRHATALVEGRNEPFLAFMISLNQANVQVRLGDQASSAASLAESKSWCEQLDYRLGWHEIQHVEGNLNELGGDATSAEKSYLEALDGFLGSNEPRLAVLVSLELALLDSYNGRRPRALDLSRWSIPILQSMRLHEETVAAIELLARGSAAMHIDQSVLIEVVRLLGLDPLVGLGQQTKAGRVSRPSCLRL